MSIKLRTSDSKLEQKIIEPNDYNFEINSFKGPIWNLLEDIKYQKIDIFDISVNFLVQQFENYVNDNLNDLDNHSTNLKFITTLMLFKVKKLLPLGILEINIENEEINRDSFIKSILELAKFQKASEHLKENYIKRGKKIDKLFDEKIEIKNNLFKVEYLENKEKIDPITLFNLAYSIIERIKIENPNSAKIKLPRLSIEARQQELFQFINENKGKKIEFETLFLTYNIHYVVITLFIFLEFARNGLIDFFQEGEFSKIFIYIK